MIICGKCSRPAEDGAAFCSACGSPLALPRPNAGGNTPAAPVYTPPAGPNGYQPPARPGKPRRGLLIGLLSGGVALILALALVVTYLLRGPAAEGRYPLHADVPSSGLQAAIVPPAQAPAAAPADFWALVDAGQAQAYDVYTSYDTTVGRDMGRVLMAPGWKMNREIYWEFQSLMEPATILSLAVSPDGQAGILSRSGARFLDIQNAGLLTLPDPDSAAGVPRRARMTPEQLIEEFAPAMYSGLSGLQISRYERVDDQGRLLDNFTLNLAGELQNAQAVGNRVENIYCEYGVARGRATIDGQQKDVEIYIELEGYDVVVPVSGGEARLGLFGMSGLTVLYAPPASLENYIYDIALILYNAPLNGHWLDLRRNVSENMLQQVNSGALTHWADAWLYADDTIAAAQAAVPDAQDYLSYRAERIDLEGIQLNGWEPGLQRFRYVSQAGDLFVLDKEWAGVWYDGGTSLMVCAVPGHTPDEVAGYTQLELEPADY